MARSGRSRPGVTRSAGACGAGLALAAGLGLGAGAGPAGPAARAVRRVAEDRVELPPADPAIGPRMDRAYFVAGGRVRWDALSASLTGTFDRVGSMTPSPDGRWLALGIRRAARGPADVALEVVALATGPALLRARFGGGAPAEPQVVAVTGGHLGFAYRDGARRQAVLLHFVVDPPRS